MMFLAMMQGTAQAELLAYEGFDYTSGQGLSGQGGSSDGWSGAWSGGASNVEAPGMTYSGLPSSGNRVGPTATFNSNLRNLDVNGAFAAFQEVNSDGDDVIGKDGTSIWLSMLWKSAGYGRGWSLGLRDDLLGGAGAAVNIGTKTNIVNSPLALFNSDLSTVVNLSAATSSTEFLLAEVIFGAGDNDTLNLYRNEDPTADPSTFVVDATISGFDMGFYGVVIKTGPAHTFGIDEMDEIRIGETVNDVLGITAAIWDGGGGAGVTNWGTSSNWNSDTDPGLVEVQFASAGTAATMDVSDTVKSVTFNRAGNFDIAAGGGTLTINEGITTTTANQFGIAAPVTLGASQSFDVFSGSTLTISGAIGDGGNGYAITKTSAGTLVLSGANTYTGGTTVTAGTLAGTTTSLQGAVTNNAAVVFDQAGSGTYAGDMGGSGTLTKLGAGNVTLSGTNTYSGGTTVTTGTLTGTTTSLQGAVTNNAAVVFDQAGSGAYAGDMGGSGTLTKLGAGNVTLSGTNTYSGGTTVTTGTLTGTTASLQGAVTNNAAVVFDQAGSGAYAGDMGGSGTLTKLGAGNVTLSGTNTYSGGTTVTTGTLTGTTTSLQGAVTNNAVVVFDQAATGTYAGIMSGTGTLIKTGAGTLTLSSTNTYSGGTTVTAGTLSGTSSSLQGAITNNAAVAFDQSADGTYADIISGSGTLTKTGAGRLTVSGNNTYTGTTTLSAGTLNLTGQLFGDVVVNGGTFMGTGTIANSGDLTLNSGSTFAPGASIGTTNIAGNYVQNSGSTLEVEVLKNADNSLSSDLIDVTGTANLASGSTINVTDLTPTDRFILTGDTFTIITTGGGVTDNGTAVTDTSAVLSFAGSISGNDYILTATRSPFASSATGKNNSSLLGAVDSDMSSTSFTSDVTLINALSSLSAAQLNNAAEQLSPQTYASPATLSTNTSRRLSSNLSGHLGARRSNNTHWAKPGSLSSDNDLLLADASGNPELLGYVIRETEKRRQQVGTTQETGYLFLPFGTFYNQDSTDNVIGFSAKAVGIHFGYDYHFSDHLILGLGGAYAHSFIKNDYDLGKANVDSFRLGPYGTYFKDKWFVDGSVTFGYHHNKTRRNIRFGGVDRTAHGEYDAYDIHTFLKAGRDFDRGGWTLTPFASLAYTYYRSENFEESEADSAGLNVDARTQQSLLGKLGFHLHRVSTLAHMKIIPEVFVGCTHQFIDENDINARFMNGVTKFSTDVDRDRDDSVYYGAGLSSLLSENISAFVRYEGEHYAGGKANTVDLGLTARF